MNTRALTAPRWPACSAPQLADVNMVSAPIVAKERGIKVDEVKRDKRAPMRPISG